MTPDGTARVVYTDTAGNIDELYLLPGTDNASGREAPMGISALAATGPASASVIADSIPTVSNDANNWEVYELGHKSGSTTHSGTRLDESLTDGLSKANSAQGLSWQPALLPVDGLDAFYELSAS